MEGKINFIKTTHNTIFVRWNLPNNIKYNSGKLVSSPFTLTINGCPLSFMLSIQCQEKFIIRVHQNSSRVGRAIISIAVEDNSSINAARTSLITKWEETCEFHQLGTFLDYRPYTLTIDCKIIWLGFVNDTKKSNSSVSSLAVAPTFSDNQVFPDFTIIAGGQEIPCHKAILARHSSVFSTMFKTPMKELKENKVIIEDIKGSTMEILLKIIYTGNAEDLTDVDVILEVLHATEKYQISTVKSMCESELQLLIDEKNVLKLLEVGDKYNASQLCETCIAYIMVIRNKEILKKFKKFSREKPNIAFVSVNVLIDASSFMPILD